MNDLPALRVRQWLDAWNEYDYEESERRRRPQSSFLLLSMPVGQLRRLCGIYRRSAAHGQSRDDDLGIQRRHDAERSDEIREFVEAGYPWSDLTKQRRATGRYNDLKKPGWLPTAVIVNIVVPEDRRRDGDVAEHDYVRVLSDGPAQVTVRLPQGAESVSWRPASRPPLEVIDGQHRLWAFAPHDDLDFELPVVAFVGLDLSWQAYVFWTVNIKPKRINASLAFDLYPLLRTEDWLERFEGAIVYRETRAQELTALLWGHRSSPWYRRINMLGEGRAGVSQAAWIRSLLATFVKAFEGRGVRQIGGLYGAPAGEDTTVLPWTSAQQAAYLIEGWRLLSDAVARTNATWAHEVRSSSLALGDVVGAGTMDDGGTTDPAFCGRFSLLNTDQGVRGVLSMLNDLSYLRADELHLRRWSAEVTEDTTDERSVTDALSTLRRQPAAKHLQQIAVALAKFDWRTSAAPDLAIEESERKAGYRGSGGYRNLRRDLLHHLATSAPLSIARHAAAAISLLGLDRN